MRSLQHQQGEILGTALFVLLVLSVYAAFVGVVGELFGHDFIESVSLSSQIHSKDGDRFAMGDTIIVSAKVRCSNVYHLSVHDNSDLLVFQDTGAVNGSDVNVSMPMLPPVFNASRVFSLAFDASLVNYPLPGVVSHDSYATSFTAVKSLTRLNLTARYDGATMSFSQ